MASFPRSIADRDGVEGNARQGMHGPGLSHGGCNDRRRIRRGNNLAWRHRKRKGRQRNGQKTEKNRVPGHRTLRFRTAPVTEDNDSKPRMVADCYSAAGNALSPPIKERAFLPVTGFAQVSRRSLGRRFAGDPLGGKWRASASPQISMARTKPSAGVPARMPSVTDAMAAFHGPSPTA